MSWKNPFFTNPILTVRTATDLEKDVEARAEDVRDNVLCVEDESLRVEEEGTAFWQLRVYCLRQTWLKAPSG